MKIVFIAMMLVSSLASAKQLFQCAVDEVDLGGARVNVNETNGKVRANLIFGTTVSGTMYNVTETESGYNGSIRSKPEFTLELAISSQKAKNSNIDGYKSRLKAVYPTVLNELGYKIVETDLVCGRKISDRWN